MTIADPDPLFTIRDIRPVDDAGAVHFETTWTAAYLVELVANNLLRLEGNIRPDHNAPRMGSMSRRKIEKWADDCFGTKQSSAT